MLRTRATSRAKLDVYSVSRVLRISRGSRRCTCATAMRSCRTRPCGCNPGLGRRPRRAYLSALEEPRMPSFDVVSKLAMHEVDNAVQQAQKEVATRYDFRDMQASIERNDDGIILRANAKSRVEAAYTVL